ncbi:hypoxia induced protein conserved region-domain-containing protein [Coniochaeta sp. 2T2.1]|nr:hypoxia induced protein conserved region-domain-containing protein [Coniochaeta sp. 2T2.1]
MSDRSPISDRPLPSSFDENEDFFNENGLQKFLRKMKKEPLIPIGMALTVGALYNATRSVRRGDHKGAQKYFRARVAAQGFTVLAMVFGGYYYQSDRHKEREQWKLQRERDSQDQKQRWIRELEIRDEEEKALQARIEKRRERAAGKRSTTTGEGGPERQSTSEAVEQMRAGTKGSAQAEGASDAPTKLVAQGEVGGETVSIETKEGKGVLGALGGLFGGGKGNK